MAGGRLILAAPRRRTVTQSVGRRVAYRLGRRRYRRRFRRNMRVKKTILPRRLFTKLKYVTANIGQTTTTALAIHQFAANGLYDPDLSGTGHQPYGFDQLASIYNDYRVHGCQIKLTGRMLTSSTSGVVMIGFNGSPAYPTALGQAMESVKNKYRIVNFQDIFHLSKYAKINNIFGKSNAVIRADPNYAAGYGANPATLAYGYIGWQNFDEATSTGWNFNVEITYFCEFNDLKIMSQS